MFVLMYKMNIGEVLNGGALRQFQKGSVARILCVKLSATVTHYNGPLRPTTEAHQTCNQHAMP